MSIGRAIKRRVKAALAPAFFLSLVAYFVWNTNQGDHGRRSYDEQIKLLAEAQSDQAAAITEETAVTRRVNELRNHSLDADMLDERARAMTGLADPRDIVVHYGPNDRLY